MSAVTSAQKVIPLPSNQNSFQKAIQLYEKGSIAEAIQLYNEILQKEPHNKSVWLNLGTAYRQIGHHEAAAACAKRVLEHEPDNTSALTNYGNCLTDLDQKEEALQVHAKAAQLRPEDFLVQRNYAVALREFGMFEEALKHFQIAQKLRPDDSMNAWEIAITLLHLGEFKKGWDAFEIRWKHPHMKERNYPVPRWNGEDLKGKTILIYEEQGFGDTILCSRYIPLIKAQGAQVILECKEPLHRLFSFVPGIDCLTRPEQTDVAFDYHVLMMSLPGIFGTDLETIPAPAPFLVPSALPPKAAQLLNMGADRLKVGIVWSGSVTFANNRRRAVEAQRFLSLARVPGVQLYSLQKGPREKDLDGAGAGSLVLDLCPYLGDFADTAAILKKLDLIIMTDSAVAHLAGSLGVPVWNLLCYTPYWLYLSERQDCPWYSSMRLFRQPTPGDWDSVFETVANELEKISAEKRKPEGK